MPRTWVRSFTEHITLPRLYGERSRLEGELRYHQAMAESGLKSLDTCRATAREIADLSRRINRLSRRIMSLERRWNLADTKAA